MKLGAHCTNHKVVSIRALGFLLLALSIIPISCSEDEPALDAATQRNVNVNSWIYKNMDFWYLWNDKLPASPDKKTDPESFFASLLYTAEDRFSWIQDDYQELLNSLKGVNKEAGYEFVLYRESEGSTNAVAQILYVKPGSPALAAGLKRGDLISHINEQQLSTANYQQLLRATSENYSIRYKPLLVEEKKFDTEKTISLVPVQYAENPNLLNKVITVNDRKIGYYVYNLFTSGTDANAKAYDNEMDNVFAGFKSQGITDLVLDLRYNSGGSETSATNLASLIGKGVNNTHVFAKREYNTQVKDAILKDPNLGAEFLITKFLTKASNVGSQLASNRVYVLTSSRTASASELVINALKPYMDVFIIGDVTYGKNVGSISLYEENDPNNTWGMQPIVVKVYNSLDQSDYGTGFTPNVLDEDNSLYLYPLGDDREALLRKAIDQITGVASSGRIRTREEIKEIIGHSLDQKRSSFRLIIDTNIPEALKYESSQ